MLESVACFSIIPGEEKYVVSVIKLYPESIVAVIIFVLQRLQANDAVNVEKTQAHKKSYRVCCDFQYTKDPG